MTRSLIIIFFILCSFEQIIAQNIIGKIVDEKQQPLPYVSVLLQRVPDSTYVAGVASKQDGSFELPAKNGDNYILLVSFMGYKSVNKVCKAGNVGTIIMEKDIKLMDEIVVIAQRTQHDANGYTINLRSSGIVKGKQSSEALAFLPGISKEDGNFKINGLAVSEIYIDGVKLSNFDELNSLPADMIDKVRVNYLAGSNQNASMSGGTINITLHQPPKGGFYGNLLGGIYNRPDYGFNNENLGGVFYYRYGNLSIYNNLYLNWNQENETADQTIGEITTDLLTRIKEEAEYRGFSIRNRLSLTQQLNAKSSLGGSYYISSNHQKSVSSTTIEEQNALQSAINTHNNYLDQEATIKYSTILNNKGMSLDIVGDYFNRNENSDSYYKDSQASQATDESSLNLYKLSVDLIHPNSQKLMWQYGASVQLISSKYDPQNITNETDRFPTSLISTRSRGLTPLAYLQAKGMVWKLRYSIGVNWQLNKIKYEELENNSEESSNTQWGINPTIQIMMPLDKKGKHVLMLNYKRTLNDIPYAAISSTIRWSDAYNYTVGNPDLKSPTSDILMAGASLFGNKLNLTALFTHIHNNIYWETMQSPADPNVFYTTPINLSSLNAFGIGAELNQNPWKPWNFKLSGRLEIHPEDITIGGVYYNRTRLRQYYSMFNTFNFSHSWGGMLNILLEPTYKTFDRTYHTVYNIGGKIYKSLHKDALQLSLTFNALGNRRRYNRQANGHTVTFDYTTPVQSIGFSIVWHFSGGKQVDVNALEGAQNYKEVKDIR